jgi:hypothetical protein
MTEIKLTGNDAAIVFKEDGDTEVYLPAEVGDLGPDSDELPNVIATGLCIVMLSDTAFGASIRAMVEAHMRAVTAEMRGEE